MKRLGKILQRERIRSGFTKKQVSKEIGISADTILRVENGRTASIYFILKLASYYGMDLHFYLRRTRTNVCKSNRGDSQ